MGEKKRGFLTVATGRYYYYLAENFAMSYRLYSEQKYPIYVITDEAGAHKLGKYFDGVIVLKNPNYTYMDKMQVYYNTPFEETIFIDVDSDIVDDISFLFDDFDDNGSDISCIGTILKITDKVRPNHFGETAMRKLNLDSYIAFNGGVYYFKKSQLADAFFEYVFNDLVPNYANYELTYFDNKMADEPLFGVGMLKCGMKPYNPPKDIMNCVAQISNLSWDMENRRCSFIKYGNIVSPIILHYATGNTYSKKYVYYNSLCKIKYKKVAKIFQLPIIVKDQILLFIRCCFYKPLVDDRIDWFKGHFTKEYLYLTLSRLGLRK